VNQESGFSVSKPVKLWNKSINADFKELFKSLGKAGIDGLLGKWEEVAKDALDATAALGLTDKPEEIAWLLIYRSLTQAVFDLVEGNKELLIEKPNASDFELLSNNLNKSLESIEVHIDQDFFKSPKKLPIIKHIQTALINWLQYFSINQAQAETISNRLPTYFVFALHQEWSKNPDKYACLKEELNTPFTKAAQKEQAWQLYLAWLQKQVEEPIFDEAFGLKQVYVPLRAYYQCPIETGKDDDFAPKGRDNQKYQRIVINLEDELDDWLKANDPDDAIRVISGGPGSGKSSFAKIFAANQAEKGHIPVLFIPLHHFEPSDDLVDAVGKFVRDDGFFGYNPLEVNKSELKLLIIFDGLDELAMQGKIATETAQQFIREVQRKLEKFNGRGDTRLKILISGRELVIQANSSDFRKPQQILYLLPYFVCEEERENYFDNKNLLEQDQRQDWWKLYGIASGFEYAGLPEELNKENLTEITTQPLLNYLVALSYVRGKVQFSQNSNLNVIYEDLLKAVYERGWERHKHQSLQGIGEKDFIRILEEIALASWHGNGRTTTVREIETHCNNGGLKSLLENFQEGAKLGVTRLLAAFYFRESGANNQGDKTFEFTHKSFGEYLTAKRIVREVRLIHKKLEDRKNDLDEGWDKKEALTRWAILCGASPMDDYLFNFIVDELRLQELSDVDKWQQTLSNLISFVLSHGMPMEQLGIHQFDLENFQSRNAEEALLVVLNACARLTRKNSDIQCPYIFSFGRWISRLRGQRLNADVFSLNHLSFLCLQGAILHIQDFFNANFEGANLENAQMLFVNLVSANLRNANLENANLGNANLVSANFQGANLQGANLEGADLQEANLEGANLEGANLQWANLQGTILEGKDLTDLTQNADSDSTDNNPQP
jgi:uncharacterized protein YjbI with pentapeptide repeats